MPQNQRTSKLTTPREKHLAPCNKAKHLQSILAIQVQHHGQRHHHSGAQILSFTNCSSVDALKH